MEREAEMAEVARLETEMRNKKDQKSTQKG